MLHPTWPARPWRFRGTVDAEVVDWSTWQEVVLSVQEARPRGGDWQPASGRVRSGRARWSAVAYGDRLEARASWSCQRREPNREASPTGGICSVRACWP